VLGTARQVGRRPAADCQRYVVVAVKDVWPYCPGQKSVSWP
jgi:hypothetical protein